MTRGSEEQSTLGTSLMVFLLGVAVGATVAILYAPAAGTDTRAQIADKASQLKDRAADISQQVAARAEELKGRVVARTHRVEGDVESTMQADGGTST
jgi:gas vesicle protein